MKKRTVLIVPPQGAPLRAIRIRVGAAFFIAALVVGGGVGLFLPFTLFSNDIIEQTQRKNLTEHNRALLQKIISTLRLLKELKARIAGLERQKAAVADISGKVSPHTANLQDNIDCTRLKTEEVLSLLDKIEKGFAFFLNAESDSGNPFDTMPVIPPVPPPILISCHFGSTTDPFTGKTKWHNGTDFIGKIGTPVVATASGTVIRVEKSTVWGNRVVISHSSDISTVYAHLGTVKTSQGKRVKRGEIIGEIGLTGLTSGPHVHYEIWHKSKVLNPEDYLFPSHLFAIGNKE